MEDRDIAEDVRWLLGECIRSYEALEALLLLQREQSVSAWGVGAVARALRVSEQVADEALADLHRRGLLAMEDGTHGPLYRYEPASAELARATDALARAYAGRPLAVVRLMSENAIARVRTSASRALADAFVLGRKRDEDG